MHNCIYLTKNYLYGMHKLNIKPFSLHQKLLQTESPCITKTVFKFLSIEVHRVELKRKVSFHTKRT